MPTTVLNLQGTLSDRTGLLPIEAFQAPNPTQIAGVWMAGNGTNVGRRNLHSGAELAWQGTPMNGTSHLTLSGAAYLQTELSETSSLTIVATFRTPAVLPSGVGIIGNHVSGESVGACLAVPSTGSTIRAIYPNSAGAQVLRSVPYTPGTWVTASFRLGSDGKPSLVNHTDAASDLPTSTPGHLPNSQKLTIGRIPLSGYASEFDLNSIIVYNADIGASGAAAAYQWAKGYAARCGISV